MQKHLSICAAKEGITYSFDNSEIIDYQDNFKHPLQFTSISKQSPEMQLFYSKMFVISYSMIFSFNEVLKFDKLVTFRSFPQPSN